MSETTQSPNSEYKAFKEFVLKTFSTNQSPDFKNLLITDILHYCPLYTDVIQQYLILRTC